MREPYVYNVDLESFFDNHISSFSLNIDLEKNKGSLSGMHEEKKTMAQASAPLPSHGPPEAVHKSSSVVSSGLQEKEEPSTSGEEQPENDEKYMTGISFFLLLAGVALVSFLFLLDVTVVSTVCP
jgi:hypothetical protein